MSKAIGVTSCDKYGNILVNYFLSEIFKEFKCVDVGLVGMDLGGHPGSKTQNDESAGKVLLIELLATVDTEITKSMKGWKFDLSIDLLVSEDIVKAGDEIIEVLVHSLFHAS